MFPNSVPSVSASPGASSPSSRPRRKQAGQIPSGASAAGVRPQVGQGLGGVLNGCAANSLGQDSSHVTQFVGHLLRGRNDLQDLAFQQLLAALAKSIDRDPDRAF